MVTSHSHLKSSGDPQPTRRHLSIEYVALGEISKWPRNPKEHDLGAIGASFQRFGYLEPMAVNENNGQLIWGHGRLDVLIERRRLQAPVPEGVQVRESDGEWLVPVIRGVYLTDDEHAAYVLASNRTVELGGWNDKLTAELLRDLDKGPGIEGTGFTLADLTAMVEDLPELNVREVPGMEIRTWEHWDYLVFVFRDSRDWLRALTLMGVERVNASAVPNASETPRIGIGRVIDGKQFLAAVERDHVAGPSGKSADASTGPKRDAGRPRKRSR